MELENEKMSNIPSLLIKEDFENLNSIAYILEPLEEASLLLSGEGSSPISTFWVINEELEKQIKPRQETNSVMGFKTVFYQSYLECQALTNYFSWLLSTYPKIQRAFIE